VSGIPHTASGLVASKMMESESTWRPNREIFRFRGLVFGTKTVIDCRGRAEEVRHLAPAKKLQNGPFQS